MNVIARIFRYKCPIIAAGDWYVVIYESLRMSIIYVAN